jgi:hypothetical protein
LSSLLGLRRAAAPAEVAVFRFHLLPAPSFGLALLPRLLLCLMHGVAYRRSDLCAALARLRLCLMRSV